MNKFTNILFFSLLVLVCIKCVFTQTDQRNAQKSIQKKISTIQSESIIKETGQFDSAIDEIKYYAPIRYVIVYNEIFSKLNERRMEILIDEKSFSKENLTIVFTHLAKKFTEPLALNIIAHTSLATIATPEEKKMKWDGEDTRFMEKRYNFKDAYFTRYGNGLEVFRYITSLHPQNYERVVLVEEAIK